MRGSVDQVTSVSNSSQSDEIDRWEKQPEWSKTLVKIWITLELGWYAGWMIHVLHLL